MVSFLPTQVAPGADTLVVVQSRDIVDVVIALAAASVAATFVALLATIVLFLAQAWKAARSLEAARKKVSLDPAVASLRRTAENLEAISQTARTESSRLSGSVGKLSERVQQASDRMEERIEEFNALLEVVQGEAENAFVDSAARARGIQAGLSHLTGEHRRGISDSGPSRGPDRGSAPAHPETPPLPGVPNPDLLPDPDLR